MKTSDFSLPRRMSGSALWLMIAKGLREYAGIFVILIIAKLIDTDGQHALYDKMRTVSVLFAGYLALAALPAFIGWYFKKYYIEGGKLIFIHGFFGKETTSIPLDKVQSMRTKQGFLYRVLGVRGVLFDTLASKLTEIELILDERDWKSLMERVETQEAAADIVADDEAQEQTVSLSFSNSNLIKGAFCQNHLQGMAVLFAALSVVYDTVSGVDYHAVEHLVNYVDTQAGALSLRPSDYVAAALVLYFFVMLLWIGKVFLRYANMRVRMARGYLTFESGLISRGGIRFMYDKVCTVYVKHNFLERRLHGGTVILRQAVNATDRKRGADIKVYGSDSEADFLGWWLGKDYGSSAEIISARSGYGLMWHVMRIDILLSLAAAAVFACFGLYVWLAVPAAWLVISLVKGGLAVRRSRITLKEDYIEIHNGKFADIRNYVKYGNVEVVRLKATPFTPYTHRLSLTLSTNGTAFTLRSLKEQQARDICERLVLSCEA